MPRMVHLATLVIASATLVVPSSAEVTFDWVTVGNPGNAEDPLISDGYPGIGSVAYEYRIAKHEVTNDQYVQFLNKVAAVDANSLYYTPMGSNIVGGIIRSGSSGSFTYIVKSNMGSKPVGGVSFFSAMRFVNWLHNGQPDGEQDASTTEVGVYAISDGLAENRAEGARFFIPTENEWYKAAYHQPSAEGGDSDDYWRYPTSSNSRPLVATATATGDIGNPGINVANYLNGADWNGHAGNVTTVGSAGPGSESFYGTSDQGGNVAEWNETVTFTFFRVVRGGDAFSLDSAFMQSILQDHAPSTANILPLGLRVASPVPMETTVPTVPTLSEWGLTAMTLLMLAFGKGFFMRRTAFAHAA